jgi:hypothetical protein
MRFAGPWSQHAVHPGWIAADALEQTDVEDALYASADARPPSAAG